MSSTFMVMPNSDRSAASVRRNALRGQNSHGFPVAEEPITHVQTMICAFLMRQGTRSIGLLST
jgi:hypothetical protein